MTYGKRKIGGRPPRCKEMVEKSKDQQLDEALAESFPASDPLPMNPG
jgi:hypothetical protein